jgi:hypothetical protein
VEYVAQSGVLSPKVLPTRCPCDEVGCHVTAHSLRQRKTGPAFPLTVIRCVTHGRAYTLYPPGQVPYGRVAIAPVDPSGRLVTSEEGEPSLSGTLYESVEDAAHDDRWPESGGEAHGTRRTQGRRLHRVAVLLGLLADPRQQERMAHALDVPQLSLREAATAYDAARSWRLRGEALLGVLSAVLASRRHGGLLEAGHEAGLWGLPRRWDPGGARFVARF